MPQRKSGRYRETTRGFINPLVALFGGVATLVAGFFGGATLQYPAPQPAAVAPAVALASAPIANTNVSTKIVTTTQSPATVPTLASPKLSVSEGGYATLTDLNQFATALINAIAAEGNGQTFENSTTQQTANTNEDFATSPAYQSLEKAINSASTITTLPPGITVDGVQGLKASDIPPLAYLSTSGGTVSGNLTVTGAFSGSALSLADASTTELSVFGPASFGATATSTFDSAGDLTVAGNTALHNLTFVNSTGTAATTTSLFAATGSLSSLSIGATATSSFSSAGALTLASALSVQNGGTGESAIAANALLLGNGTGAIATTSAGTNGQALALVGSVPTWVATTTFSSGLQYANGNVTNSGVLSLTQSGGGSAQTGAITLATSTLAFDGLTIGTAISNSGGTFTFTPTMTGTLNNSGLANSTIGLATPNSTLTISGSPASLGGSLSADLNLAHGNTWTVLQQFQGNASTTAFSAYNGAFFGATATSSFDTAGDLTLAGTLTANGNTTLANATTTSLFVKSALASNSAAFGATATSSFSTAGALTLASALTIGNGGTGTTTGGVTNGIEYYNGSTLTNGSGLVYLGGNVRAGLGNLDSGISGFSA